MVQCVNYITWTTAVTEAILEDKLAKQVQKCTTIIEQCVKLVQGKLEPGHQITVEALIVIDVHG